MKNKLFIADDGLVVPEVGVWAEKKYKLIRQYAEMFSTGMKNKWDCRVYVDLFAGAGKAKIKRSERIVEASPLIVLSVKDKFDRYIFCEKDPGLMDALSKRVSSGYGDVDTAFVPGDANQMVDEIIAKIPKASSHYRVLAFCLVDPFNLSSLEFSTIHQLSERYMDFLVLVACNMDAHRNVKIYEAPENTIVECFLGNSEWRGAWDNAKCRRRLAQFSDYIVEAFSREMEKLQYKTTSLDKTVLIRQPKNRSPLYRLAFFSRNSTGMKFWAEACKYSKAQCEFDFSWN